MPQPLSKVCPNATVSLHLDHSTNKPELAILVTGIFARWAWIEQSISGLLLHILGAEAKPALAMFSVLNGQRLQMSAVKAAAEAALPSDQYRTNHPCCRICSHQHSNHAEPEPWSPSGRSCCLSPSGTKPSGFRGYRYRQVARHAIYLNDRLPFYRIPLKILI